MRLKYVILQILLYSIFPTFSYANECTTTRLDAPGGPLEGFPVKHQDGLGLCDHYAACQIINAAKFYKYGKNAFKNDCSPIAAAATLTPIVNGTRLEQLSMEQVLYHIGKTGTCNDEIVINKFGSDTSQNFCEELKFAFNQLKPNKDFTAAGSADSSSEKRYCGISINATQNYDGIQLVSKFLKTSADLNAVSSAINQICQNHMQNIAINKIDRVLPKDFSQENRFLEIKQSIDRSLNSSQPMPAGIKYCKHVLHDMNSIGVRPDGILDKNICVKNNQIGNHSSVVIGRRFNNKTNSCEYLVRNSEGTSCSQYDKRLECDKTRGGLPCPPNTECGGQVWVPEAKLFANISTVVGAQ